MKVIEKFESALYILLCIFQFMLSITIFTAVIARYVFGYPLPEVNVVQNFSLVWLVLLGSGLALKNKEHLDIDILTPYLSEKTNAVRSFIIDMIVMAAILLLLAVGYKSFLAGFTRTELTPIRFLDGRISMVYFNSAFLFGAITMFAYQSFNIIKSFKNIQVTKNNGVAK